MGEMRNAYKILAGKLRGRASSEDIGVGGKIKFEWMLQR
jgi:hypothetical protein